LAIENRLKKCFIYYRFYFHYKKKKEKQPYDIVVSKVIHNSYNVHENYLTLNSGALQGVESDMGVINNLGLVGIIDNTSPRYSTVISF
jgi:rod shape-determining protein MreC